MGLTQIRDAAWASGFTSRKQQDQWLAAAVGDNRRYLDQAAWRLRRSLRLCPMQGEAYLYLAETAFLDGLGPAAKHAYIDQAQRLRPYEGVVMMAVGQDAALEGNLNRAMEFWKQAFHHDPESQQRVIELLAGGVSAEQFLDYLQPDTRGLGKIYIRYRYLNRREDAVLAGRRYAPLLEEQAQREKGADAARLWATASGVYQYLEDAERSLECIARAVRAAPADPATRRNYGFQLLDAQRYDDALTQFQWCLRYNPDDEPAQAGLNRSLRRGLSSGPVADQRKDRAVRY
jgi:tetratricopeptide (TPR) repeat protein